jgi:glycosyltransferase involved in cell wall biosynthesis
MIFKNKVLNFLIIQNDALSMFRFRSDLIERIKNDGHRVDAISAYDDFYSPKIEEIVDNYYPMKIYRWINILSDLKLAITFSRFLIFKRLTNRKYNIVHTITAKPNLIMGPIARIILGFDIRLVALISGLGSFIGPAVIGKDKNNLINKVKRKLLKFSFLFFDGVWLQNPDDIDLMVKFKIIPKRKIVLAYGSGISLKEKKHQDKALLNSYIQKYSKNKQYIDDRYILLCAARAIEEKGILDFINAINLKDNWDGKFILVAPAEANGVNCLAGVNSNKNVLIINQFQDPSIIDTLIQNSYAVCLPSYYREGVPRFLLEGLCQSKPIITSNSPGCKETVLDKINGFIVNPRDPYSLANAIQKIFSLDQKSYNKMCLSSRSLVAERFSSDKIYEIIKKELYRI